MRDLKKQEWAVIEAVARRFSPTWGKESDLPDAYIKVHGKRVVVDIATLKQYTTDKGDGAKPRLRFDKVATRLMERLRANLGETVPDGMTVVVTITAPIRLASKTAAVLERKMQTLLGRRLAGQDEKDTVHGNHVRIRLLRNGWKQTPKMIGFVHNSDTDPLLLLSMTRELLELLSAETGRQRRRLVSKRADERWLVATSARGSSCLETYRYIYSQLRLVTDFKKILMAFGDGRAEALTE